MFAMVSNLYWADIQSETLSKFWRLNSKNFWQVFGKCGQLYLIRVKTPILVLNVENRTGSDFLEA
jgi:hypothetical protein